MSLFETQQVIHKRVDDALSPNMTHTHSYRTLIHWLIQGGASFSKLYLNEYYGGNRGVHVSQDHKVAKGDEVVEIPLKFLITGSLAMNSEIGIEIQESSFEPVSSYPFIACFILQEKFLRGDKSFWKPWLDVIPSMKEAQLTLPVCFSEERLEILRGTEAFRIASQRRRRNRKEYEQLCKHVRSVRENFSYEQFVWARCITTTRSYGINIDGAFNSAIVPFADMFNHSCERQTRWTFDNTKSAFVVTSLQEFCGGDPIHVFYGSKNNGRFMAHYGFHIPENDKVIVSLSEHINLTFASDWPFSSLLVPLRSRSLCRRKVLRKGAVPALEDIGVEFSTPPIESSARRFLNEENNTGVCRSFFKKRNFAFRFRSKKKASHESSRMSKSTKRDHEEGDQCTCEKSFPKLCSVCSSVHFDELVSGFCLLNEAEALVMLKKICEDQLLNYDTAIEEDMEELKNLEEDGSMLKVCLTARLQEKLLFQDVIDFVNSVLPLFSLNMDEVKSLGIFQSPPGRYRRYFSEVLVHLLLKEETIA